MATSTKAKRYTVLAGLNYPVKGEDVRAEVGDVVDDLPASSVGWLIEQGLVAPVVEA